MSSGRRLAIPPVLLLAALAVLAAGPARAAGTDDDVYPSDIKPPAGTQYPCALTALPRALPGIPEADRAYLNATYARVLKATQAKLVLLKSLEEASTDLDLAARRYQETLSALRDRQAQAPARPGLEGFQADMLAALDLQRAFFSSAVPARRGGASMPEVYRIPEGRRASGRLIAAWGRMQVRYRGWPAETRDSVYHHLCALDLF